MLYSGSRGNASDSVLKRWNMSPNEEARETGEQLFRSYTDAGSGSSVRRRWMMVVFGVCGVFVVVALVFWAYSFMRPTPYDAVVRRLYPGMSYIAATEELGEPFAKTDMGGHSSWLYRVAGTNLPLVIQFFGGGRGDVENWCVFVPDDPSQPSGAEGVRAKLVCHKLQ
jgi:hypothetical protein